MSHTCPTCGLRFEKKAQMNRHQKYHTSGDDKLLCFVPGVLGCKTAPTMRRVMPWFLELNCMTCDMYAHIEDDISTTKTKIGGAQ